jgi:ABC-type transporter Mla subunit MlaD
MSHPTQHDHHDEHGTHPASSCPWLPVTRDYLDRGLERIVRRIRRVEEILNQIGVTVSEATDLLSQINDETNAVSARIDDLVNQLANQSDASPEVLQGLRDASARLQALAADPNNPVPAPAGGTDAPPSQG